MKLLLGALAALAVTGSAWAQNDDVGDPGLAPPVAVSTGSAVSEGKAKPLANRPATPASPAAQNSVAAGPDDLGEQPINTASFDPGASTQDVDSYDRGDEGLHGHMIAVPLIIAGIGFLALSGLALYFLPTIIAVARRKRNGWAIFAVNFFFGWSFVGWVAALIWAVMSDTP